MGLATPLCIGSTIVGVWGAVSEPGASSMNSAVLLGFGGLFSAIIIGAGNLLNSWSTTRYGKKRIDELTQNIADLESSNTARIAKIEADNAREIAKLETRLADALAARDKAQADLTKAYNEATISSNAHLLLVASAAADREKAETERDAREKERRTAEEKRYNDLQSRGDAAKLAAKNEADARYEALEKAKDQTIRNLESQLALRETAVTGLTSIVTAEYPRSRKILESEAEARAVAMDATTPGIPEPTPTPAPTEPTP